MKDNQLLTALSEISPDLLEETKEPVPKKNGKLWLRIGAAAAAFLIAGAVWLRLSPFRENSVLTPTENDSSAVSSGAETETPATASDEVSGQEDGTTGEPVTEEPIRWTEEPGSYLGEKESGENLVSLGSNVVLS